MGSLKVYKPGLLCHVYFPVVKISMSCRFSALYARRAVPLQLCALFIWPSVWMARLWPALLWTSVLCSWKKECVPCLVCGEQVGLDWQCGLLLILTSSLEALPLLNHKGIYLIYSCWQWLALRIEQWLSFSSVLSNSSDDTHYFILCEENSTLLIILFLM